MGNNYGILALEQYNYIVNQSGERNNNITAFLCAQACENFLKSILFIMFKNDNRLISHNLVDIDYTLKAYGIDLKLNIDDIHKMMPYYFYTLAPSNKFIEVSHDNITECLNTLEDIKNKVVEWHSKSNNDSSIEFNNMVVIMRRNNIE